MVKRKVTKGEEDTLRDPPRRSTRQKIALDNDIDSEQRAVGKQEKQKKTLVKQQLPLPGGQDDNDRTDEENEIPKV